MMSPRCLILCEWAIVAFFGRDWKCHASKCPVTSFYVGVLPARPSTTLAVMKAWERGYVHVVVLVVSFPYCKDLVPSPKHRLVSFLYHGMGLRLLYKHSNSMFLQPGFRFSNSACQPRCIHTWLVSLLPPSVQVTKNTNSLKMQTQISQLCSSRQHHYITLLTLVYKATKSQQTKIENN